MVNCKLIILAVGKYRPMKFRLTVVIFFFLTSCSVENSVTPTTEGLPTSKDKLVEMLDASDDSNLKLAIYWQLFKQLSTSDPESVRYYLSQMEALSREEGNYEFVGRAYHGRGFLDKVGGKPIQAVRNYLEAISHYDLVGAHDATAIAINNIGVIFLNNGDYEYAITYFEKAKEIYLQVENETKLVSANINLGICHAKKANPDYRTAGKYYDEAIALNIKESSRQGYYYNKLYNLKGDLYNITKKYARSVANFKQSLEYLNKDDYDKQVIAHYNVGEALIGDKKYDEAKLWLDKALALGEKADLDGEVMTECYNILGQLYQGQDNHKEAIHNFEIAIAIADKEVSNSPLRKALRMIRSSQRALQQGGQSIDVAKLLYFADINDRQVELHDALLNEAGSYRLQAALRKEIEINGLQSKLTASMLSRKRTINYSSILAGIIVMISIGVVIRKNAQKKNQLVKSPGKVGI